MPQTVTQCSHDVEPNGDLSDDSLLLIAPGIRPEPPRYLVHGLIEDGVANVLAGEMGSAKSLHALLIAMQVATGANVLGRLSEQRSVVYVDYEDEHHIHVHRANLLRVGHPEIANAVIIYLRLSRPLHEEVDSLGRLMKRKGVSFLVVDSLAMAAGAGDLQGAETPRTMQRALRQLPPHTSLFVAHPPKDASRFTVAGSGFFQNLPRMVVQQQVTAGAHTSCLSVELVYRKANHGRLRANSAFRIHFESEAIRFESSTPTLRANGNGSISLTESLAEALAGGPRPVSTLAKALNVSEAQVRSRLNDGKQRGLFVKFPDGQWGSLYKPAAV